MIKYFGSFTESQEESLGLTLQFNPLLLQARWQKYGLPVDFLADYLTHFAPPFTPELKGSVIYIANELIENAMKFHHDTTPARPIVLQLTMTADTLYFYLTHSITPAAQTTLQTFIQRLLTADLAQLYAQQVTLKESQLGYLTMLNDYLAHLAWKFETLNERIEVTTMVKVNLQRPRYSPPI